MFRKLNYSLFYILENIFHDTPWVIANLVHQNAEQSGVRPHFYSFLLKDLELRKYYLLGIHWEIDGII